MKKFAAFVVSLCILLSAAGAAMAAEDIKDPILKKLVEKGVLTNQEAISITDEMKAEAKKAEAKKAKWEGSFRMRHDSQWFDKPDKADRHRERIQGRFGFTYDINELTQVGFRLGTGEKQDQVTLNQSLGDIFELKNVWLESAYVRHKFFDKKLDVYLGKFKNPFTPYTWIVFDPDLHPEGVAIQASHEVGKPTVFINAGAFPLDELSGDSSDPWLLGIQGGLKYGEKDKFDVVVGLAHYNYSNVDLISADDNKYHGNTISDFRVYNATANVSLYLPLYVGLTADYVYNAAADENNDGYLFGITAGNKKVEQFKDWQVFTTYSRVESDATYDEFSDSDFRSGGTNNKGWTFGYRFGLGKGWAHALKYYATKAVSTQLPADKRSMEENRIQIDLTYAFKF
ncbi:MAG: putative porin [Thermodesulfovibrionales bacterium]|nr:putative porin [Thermodesulfovibrionales bacterium]